MTGVRKADPVLLLGIYLQLLTCTLSCLWLVGCFGRPGPVEAGLEGLTPCLWPGWARWVHRILVVLLRHTMFRMKQYVFKKAFQMQRERDGERANVDEEHPNTRKL